VRKPTLFRSFPLTLAVVLLLLMAMAGPRVPAAHAQTVISVTVSDGATVCPGSLSGTWNVETDTCSIESTLTISPGTVLDVGPGVNVAASGGNGEDGAPGAGAGGEGGGGGDGVDNSGTINIQGTLTGTGGNGGNGGDGVGSGSEGGPGGNGGYGILDGEFATINNQGTVTGTGGNGGAGGAGGFGAIGGNAGPGGAGGSGFYIQPDGPFGGTINNQGAITGAGGNGGNGGSGGFASSAPGGNGGSGGMGGDSILNGGTINNDGAITPLIGFGGNGGDGGAGSPSGAAGADGPAGTLILNAATVNDYCGDFTPGVVENSPVAVSCYAVTFDQSGIPSSGVTWGVTASWGPFPTEDYTGTGVGITVQMTGSLDYSYDTPVTASSATYDCGGGCAGTSSVSGATSFSASYSEAAPVLVCPTTTGGTLLPMGATFTDGYGNRWVAPSGNDGSGGVWSSYFFAGPEGTVPAAMMSGWGGVYGTYNGQSGWIVTFYC